MVVQLVMLSTFLQQTSLRKLTMTNNKDENGLLPCPFCKSGETRIDEQSFWTGMRSQVVSVSVRHWCPKNPLQSYVEVKATTREEAVKTWNTRPQQSPSGDVQLALDAQVFVDEFVARNDSESYPFDGEEYDVNLVKFAFEWLFSSDKFRAAITVQQTDVNQELLEACKKAADIFRDYERIHLYKNPPDRAKAERNGEYAYIMEQAIARAEQKCGA